MANYDFTYTGAEIQAILDTAKKLKDSGYIFLGVATPSTNPGTPTQKVYYEAKQAGTYTNFGGVVLPDGMSLLIWNGSWTSETVMCGDGGVFDISVYKSSGGTLATFADLAAALDGGNNIPASARKGGMSVKFVQSSDNKYVQYRLKKNTWSTTISDWLSDDNVFNSIQESGIEEYEMNVIVSSSSQKVFENVHSDKVPIELYVMILDGTATLSTDILPFVITNGSSWNVLSKVSNNLYHITAPESFGDTFALHIRPNVITSAGTLRFKVYMNDWLTLFKNEQIGGMNNIVFNANTYLYGKSDTTHTVTLQDAINTANSLGLNNIARMICFRDSTGSKIAIFNSVGINSSFTNTNYWNVYDSTHFKDDIVDIQNQINNICLFNIGEQIQAETTYIGKRLGTRAELIDNQDYNTIKVEVSTEKYISVKGIAPLTGMLAAAFDVNDVCLAYYEINKNATHNSYIIKVPLNTSYFLICGNTANYQASCFEASFKDLKPNIVDVRTTLANGADGNNYVLPTQTIGSSITFGDFGNHIMFTIPPKSKVKINYIATGTYGFALTDTDDKVLEYCNTYNTSVTEHTFSYQENECKLYVSASKFSSGYYDTEKGTKNLFNTIVNNLNELNKDVTAENYWKGKTLWWCGTSIPAGGNTNYPNIVSKNLDCTVINKAVGGSMCRANVRTGDYHGALFDNITSALSMTKEEIELFITNYASIQPYLRSGAPATLSDSNKARLRAASFEDRLLPYLDGTYPMPDLFVIDHGHNDWKYTLSNGNSDITLEPTVANIGGELAEDTFMTANNNAKLESFLGSLANIDSSKKAEFIASLNRNCYIGAINFIITLILKYNPRARIVFISNYEYENGDTPVYAPLITAQEYNANGWAFPLCEVYKYLGFSNHIIPGTKDYWASAGYTSTKDLDVFKIYCPDNVHPHSDTSGITNRIYAGVISEFLKKCR